MERSQEPGSAREVGLALTEQGGEIMDVKEFVKQNEELIKDMDENLVKECHDKGMKIVPWTVNDKKQVTKLKKMGVDGIITDYPDLFK